VIVFGGGSGGDQIGDTWLWTGSDWGLLKVGRSPSAGESFGMVYDEALGHPVPFGGQKGTTLYNDTWTIVAK
jgi:hypothetical protein